jgi:hypothetical protein
MADDTSADPGSDWILPPPPAGGFTIHIAVDSEASLTPELQEALEALLRAIPEEEESVQGYRKSGGGGCSCLGGSGGGRYSHCSAEGCNPYSTTNCAVLYDCRVGLRVLGP